MTNRRRPIDRTPVAAETVPQDASSGLAARQARQAGEALRRYGVGPGAVVLDLCCGLGRQAAALAKTGLRVVGVDMRSDDPVRTQWRRRQQETARLAFVGGDVRALPLRGPFDAGLLLYNGLSLFSDNADAIALFQEVRRVISPDGVLLLDNCCARLWREIAAGRYADGISADGLWQMAWQSGRNVFALRYGDAVRPDQPRPRRTERLYRAWSLDELDLLCRLTGWRLDFSSARRALLAARPC